MVQIKVQQEDRDDGTTPNPFYVHDDFTVTGEDIEESTNLLLIGFVRYFSQLRKGKFDLDYQTFWIIPELAIEFYPIFMDVDDPEGQFFGYQLKIASVEIIEETE